MGSPRNIEIRYIIYACFLSSILPLTLVAGDSRQTLASAIDVYVFPADKITTHQTENFKKAFSACLEAKNYTVKL
jgi:hypothetical protein